MYSPFSPEGLYLSNSLPDVEANALRVAHDACCAAVDRQVPEALTMLEAWLQACIRLRCMVAQRLGATTAPAGGTCLMPGRCRCPQIQCPFEPDRCAVTELATHQLSDPARAGRGLQQTHRSDMHGSQSVRTALRRACSAKSQQVALADVSPNCNVLARLLAQSDNAWLVTHRAEPRAQNFGTLRAGGQARFAVAAAVVGCTSPVVHARPRGAA